MPFDRRPTGPAQRVRSAVARSGLERADLWPPAVLLAFDLGFFWEWWRLPAPPSARDLAAPLVAVIAYGCLVYRRRHPRAVLLFASAVTVASQVVPRYHPYFAVLAALYAVAVRRPRRQSLVAAALTSVPLLALSLGERMGLRRDLGVGQILIPTLTWWAVAVVVWAVGYRIRAAADTVADLEARRHAAALEAVAAERLRIARELHDIVAHSVSVMMLQAAGARRVIGINPAMAERALTAIEEIGQESMGELRRLLGVLRSSAGDDAASEVGSQPGLADLEDLYATSRSAGIDVAVQQSGTAGRLDPSVELAAYRVVQEALTNVRKHAGPGTRASVRLDWADDAVLLTVDSDPPAGPAPADPAGRRLAEGAGYGLLGLHERVVAVGGAFDARPTPPGFRVSASLPRARGRDGEQVGQPAPVEAS